MIVVEYKLWLTEIVTEAQAHEQVILDTASSLLEKKLFHFTFEPGWKDPPLFCSQSSA